MYRNSNNRAPFVRRCKPKPAAELFEIEWQTEEGDVSLE